MSYRQGVEKVKWGQLWAQSLHKEMSTPVDWLGQRSWKPTCKQQGEAPGVSWCLAKIICGNGHWKLIQNSDTYTGMWAIFSEQAVLSLSPSGCYNFNLEHQNFLLANGIKIIKQFIVCKTLTCTQYQFEFFRNCVDKRNRLSLHLRKLKCENLNSFPKVTHSI